ncbi:MAG: hypothetical protein IPH57_02375 [Saprospiraceae bacterium]|nr:hypothetical protein [Saprospiraceae bacterium]
MKYLLFIFTFLLFSAPAFMQTPVLSEDVDLNIEKPKFGENRKNYTHFYASLGALLGKAEGDILEINSWKSLYFDFGFRYKLRLFEYNAVGFQISYDRYSFRLKYEDNNLLPIVIHDKDRLITNNLGLGVFDRINFGKRGDFLGNYLDIGAYGEFAFSRKHWYKAEQPNGEILEAELKKLKSVEKLNYGIFANLGFGKKVLFFKYRMSDMISDPDKYDEMPRFVAGIQFGF